MHTIPTSKVVYPPFFYEIPFYVREKNKQEEGDGMNRRRDIENLNDDRDNEGDNKASPSLQTPPPTTLNVTETTTRSMAWGPPSQRGVRGKDHPN